MCRTTSVSGLVLGVVLVATGPGSAGAATYEWLGSDPFSPDWNLALNWDAFSAPPNDGSADCLFPERNAWHNPNLPQAWAVYDVRIQDDVAYRFTGAQLTIGAGGIHVYYPTLGSPATHRFENSLRLGASQTWLNESGAPLVLAGGVNVNGLTLVVEGEQAVFPAAITGTGTLIVRSGVVTLMVTNPFSGTIYIEDPFTRNNPILAPNARLVCFANDVMPVGTLRIREGTLDCGTTSQIIGPGASAAPGLVLGGIAGTGGGWPQRVLSPSFPLRISTLGNWIEYRMPTYGNARIEGLLDLATASSTRTLLVERDPADDAKFLDILADVSSPASIPGPEPSLRKIGAGLLRLSGSNTFNRAFLIAEGVVELESGDALGLATPGNETRVLDGAALQLITGLTVGEPIVLRGSGVQGAGALRLLSGQSSWVGDVMLASNATIGCSGTRFTITGTVSDSTVAALTVAGGGELSLAGPLALDGPIQVGEGALRLAGAGTTGTITVASGASLLGDGGTTGAVSVQGGGHLEPGHALGGGGYGVLDLGSVNLASTSATSFRLGGSATGTSHDGVAIAGHAALAGTLELLQGGSFAPAAGDSFVVMTYQSASGEFQSLTTDLPLPPGCGLSVQRGPTSLVVRVVGPVDVEPEMPPASTLHAPVPNPMRASTTLGFELARPGRVDLEVLDACGRRAAMLLSSAERGAGRYSIPWSGRDAAGRSLPSGIYFARLSLDGQPVGAARRLVLVSPAR